jgi:probable rRNA maturation factor
LRRLADAAARCAGLPVEPEWDLNLLFVGDRSMARYNAELVGHEGTTDVITFSYFDTMDEYADGETMIELIINPDAAVREGSKRAGGYAREMVLYLVHGLLHSAGEDDLSPAPRRRMRRREKECLDELEKSFDFKAIFKEA